MPALAVNFHILALINVAVGDTFVAQTVTAARARLRRFDGRRGATVEAVTRVSDKLPMAFGLSRKY